MDSNIICKISGIDPGQIERICVDDNGCSNKVVYTLECIHPDTEYKLLFNTPSGYLTNGSRFLIGENLESSDFKDFASYDRILINFKAKPTKENRSVIKNYLKAWHEKITKKWKEYKNEETTLWIAGCPNSWEKKDIDAYRKIYNDAGYENVIIFPEGYAALLRNILLDEKGTPLYKSVSWVRKRILNTATVCVDCGGYSNEATLINEKGVRTISSGTVGSHIIDIMIICANLYDEEIEIHTDYDSEEDYEENSSTQKENFIKKYKMVGKDYEGVSLPPEEVREEMRKRFETDKKFRAFLILQGRWLKERFLNAEESNGVKFYRLTVTLDKPIPLGQNGSVSTYTFYINSRMITRLIESAPIKKTLGDKIFATLPNETREEIGDENTWIDCYYNFIEEAAKHCSYYPDSPKFEIILTGGASKTKLVRTTTHLTFKPYYTGENNKLKLDPTPFTSIATGLCAYGFEKLSSMLFDHACNILLTVPGPYDFYHSKASVPFNAEATYKRLCDDIAYDVGHRGATAVIEAKNNWLENHRIVYCTYIIETPLSSETKYTATEIIKHSFSDNSVHGFNNHCEFSTKLAIYYHFYREIVDDTDSYYGYFEQIIDKTNSRILLNQISEWFSSLETMEKMEAMEQDDLAKKVYEEIIELKNHLQKIALDELAPITKFLKNYDNDLPPLCSRRAVWNRNHYSDRKRKKLYKMYCGPDKDKDYRAKYFCIYKDFENICKEYEARVQNKVYSELSELQSKKEKIVDYCINHFIVILNDMRTKSFWIELVDKN